MKVISYLILFFFLFAGFMSPQKPTEKNNKQITIKLKTSDPQSEFEQELKKYKDSIILCATAVEESKKVIYLNEPYLKNLDKKIEELKKQKPTTAQKSELPTHAKVMNGFYAPLYKVDTVWATIK